MSRPRTHASPNANSQQALKPCRWSTPTSSPPLGPETGAHNEPIRPKIGPDETVTAVASASRADATQYSQPVLAETTAAGGGGTLNPMPYCYIMYTSGSTGTPAGVCGTEQGLCTPNFCQTLLLKAESNLSRFYVLKQLMTCTWVWRGACICCSLTPCCNTHAT